VARFFNTDLHISVIADVQHIFRNLGHSVDDWCMSAHHWVMSKERRASSVINWNNWQELSEAMCRSFYAAHRDEFAGYDGFVVTHCPPFALLFQAWEKPVFVVVSTRYNNGFERQPARLQWIEGALRYMIDSGQALCVANNRFDAWHGSQGLGLSRPLWVVESLCEYTAMHWTPNTSEVLFDKGRFPATAAPRGTTPLVNRGWQAIATCRAMVHLPYNISTMSYFEQYTAGIPLIFPSLKLLASDPRFLSELGEPRGDPGLADFYHWPAVAYFDTYEELSERLPSLDVSAMHAEMMAHNAHRKQRTYEAWSSILENL
jgi:hypothetical protein